MTSSNTLQKTTYQNFYKKIYNREKRTILGRTYDSWAKLTCFYAIFYGFLIALFAFCMWVFFLTLDPRIPKCQLDGSSIGTNPGLGFRPTPTDNLESTLIWFKGSDKKDYSKWVDNLNNFLYKYYTPGTIQKGTSTTIDCKYGSVPGENQVCNVDVQDWNTCSKDNNYQYHRSKPCIFLKLNRIYGWVPEFYNDPNNLPEDMPNQLKDHIRNTSMENPKKLNTVWISCEGETATDIEYLGPIEYFPKEQGFPGYYFPFKNTEGYLSPLIAIWFQRPITGIVINVECKAWARNIIRKPSVNMGSVHFELLID